MLRSIDYMLNAAIRASTTMAEFTSKLPAAGAIFDMIELHSGPAWTLDFIGDKNDPAVVAAISNQVTMQMRKVTGRPKAKVETVLNAIYKKWKSSRDPRFFRNQRVLAQAQHPTRAAVNKQYKSTTGKKDWYPGRIIGVGQLPNTYEILFDEKIVIKNKKGEVEGEVTDRHERVFPFLDGQKPSQAFLEGQELGRGTQMIREPPNRFTWNSVIV